ncbi:MAG: aldehyde dehydrogenase family protein, partial [Rhizobiales bacterium]|nr:aldehyde dehydrogenase family protein [Hyphomicrobiales bacterium]
MQQYALIINGEKVTTKDTFDIFNPSTGELVGKAPKATIDQVNQAVNAAETAFITFSKTSDETRQNYCNAIAEKLGEHADELAKILTQEQGKPLNGLGSRWELGGAQAWTGYTASLSLPV